MQYGSYVHVHVSEREAAHEWPDGQMDDPAWEDCLWMSAVEVLRWGGLAIPAKHYEGEALRADSGEPPTGGSNHADLARGMLVRYGITARQGQGYANVVGLDPGHAAAVNGSPGKFPAGHRLRRHDPGFTGLHTVALFHLGDTARRWWCDPLAAAGYDGEWVTLAELATFMSGADGRYTFARIGEYMPDTSTGDEVTTITLSLFPEGQRAVTGSGVTIWLPDGRNQLVATLESAANATADIAQSDNRAPKGSGWLRLSARPFAGWYVPAATVTLAPPPPPPADTTPYSQAEFDAAVSASNRSGYRAGASKVGERVRSESVPSLLADIDRIVGEETA